MTATFRLNADELDAAFIERIKTQFAHQPLEISILEQDETEYLLSNPAMRDRLLASIANLDAGKGRNILDPEEFK